MFESVQILIGSLQRNRQLDHKSGEERLGFGVVLFNLQGDNPISFYSVDDTNNGVRSNIVGKRDIALNKSFQIETFFSGFCSADENLGNFFLFELIVEVIAGVAVVYQASHDACLEVTVNFHVFPLVACGLDVTLFPLQLHLVFNPSGHCQ